MAITLEEVRHIARLANLQFSEEELQAFIVQFSKILEHIEQLSQVDTQGVEPTYHAVAGKIDRENARSDVIHASFLQEKALMNAPESEEGQFRVPKVIR
ncbi:MAG: Asp-tRNA(Asn)/Glu-tRNA(Gln) amidotransferase subunit GatC [Acidobacteria bacterium]|nr:Asp-tRNA(Asn)/Glu-tRNA(Gln) amidotransferase subunit GatC [Acidobacteriota bacterium]